MNNYKVIIMVLICCLLLPIAPVYADSSGNIGIGGGELGTGKDGYTWPGIGYDGVRITVVDAETGLQESVPIDFTNRNAAELSDRICHFGSHSKLDYRNGAALIPQIGNYLCYQPNNPLPQIISGNSSQASIHQIRQYFCSEAAAVMISDKTGIPFSEIENGRYKVVIEPMIYVIYENVYFAMTTTEAGLYNRVTGGGLASHFPTVIMQNHALALFLEQDDLGFPAWAGSTTSARSTEEMIHILGIGIVSYQEQTTTAIQYDKQYRVDTDVMISVELFSGTDKTPDSPAYAIFTINGSIYSHTDIYIPENSSQLAWITWRTPEEPGEVTISINSNCQISVTTMKAEIVSLDQNPPPDPTANDRNDSFFIPEKPSYTDISSLTWGEWDCWWQESWVWHDTGDDGGYYCDHGWFEYEWIPYSASVTGVMKIEPDEKVPTAIVNTMKSGYGFQTNIAMDVYSSAPTSHLTGIQNVVMCFPEFEYQTYWRLLKRMDTGYSSTFEFQENKYSTYGRSVHFVPVWYPDGRYTAYARCQDLWTPAGMLEVHLTDEITIKGSLFDDWHVKQN